MRAVLLHCADGQHADAIAGDGLPDFRPGEFFVSVFGSHWLSIVSAWTPVQRAAAILSKQNGNRLWHSLRNDRIEYQMEKSRDSLFRSLHPPYGVHFACWSVLQLVDGLRSIEYR